MMTTAVSTLLMKGAADSSVFAKFAAQMISAQVIGTMLLELLLKPTGWDGVDERVASLSVAELGHDLSPNIVA